VRLLPQRATGGGEHVLDVEPEVVEHAVIPAAIAVVLGGVEGGAEARQVLAGR
jgi:hypothetical protein